MSTTWNVKFPKHVRKQAAEQGKVIVTLAYLNGDFRSETTMLVPPEMLASVRAFQATLQSYAEPEPVPQS